MERTRIALALHAATTDDALRAMDAHASSVDLVEVRLDGMESCDLPRLLRERSRPVIITCRPDWEGGRYQGDEAARVQTLIDAAASGADHIDWELAARVPPPDPRVLGNTRVIRSAHDFSSMPDLAAWRRRCVEAGAGIAKVVGTARHAVEAAAALEALREASEPTIALAMGDAGLVSRILAIRYGAYLTFVSPADRAGTAPGQISAEALRGVYFGHMIDFATRPLGVICATPPQDPLVAEIAAANRGLRESGINAVAVPLVAGAVPARDVMRVYSPLGFDGFACLHPVRGAGGDVWLRQRTFLGGGSPIRRLIDAVIAEG